MGDSAERFDIKGCRAVAVAISHADMRRPLLSFRNRCRAAHVGYSRADAIPDWVKRSRWPQFQHDRLRVDKARPDGQRYWRLICKLFCVSDLAGAERISLKLRYLTGQVVIEVSDSDVNPPQMADVGVNAESGRGLMLVGALSKEWSYFFPPSGGKTVYCVLSTDEPAHMPAMTAEGGIDDR